MSKQHGTGQAPMRIGLVGTYDVDNFGDCMFPELYQALLRAHFDDAVFSLHSPSDRPAQILSADRLEALAPRLNAPAPDVDAMILTGGEMIGVGHSSGTYIFPQDSYSSYLRLWFGPAMAAAAGGPRFLAHCVGALKMGPGISRDVARVLSAADFCTFRDPFSQDWIRADDISYPVAVDPMFLLDRLLPEAEWRARAAAALPEGFSPGAYLFAQLSASYVGPGVLDRWAGAVRRIAQQTGLPVLLAPICHFLHDDLVLAPLARRLRAHGVRVAERTGAVNVKDTAAMIGCSGGYIGSSLHGAVTAVAFGKPLAVLGHSMDGKHEGSLRAVGVRGAATDRAERLDACFSMNAQRDHAEDRRRAQALAEADFARLVDALAALSPRPAALSEAFAAPAARLLDADLAPIRGSRLLRLKRLLFSMLAASPALQRRYRRWRLKRRIEAR